MSDLLELSKDVLAMPIGVYTVQLDGRFVACNAIARDVLGISQSVDITQYNIAEFYRNKDDRKGFLERLFEAAKHNSHLSKDHLHFQNRIGRDVFVEVHARLAKDDHGQPVGIVGCLVDVTQQHLEEQDRRRVLEKHWKIIGDVGNILHASANILLMVEKTLHASARTWKSSLPKESYSLEELYDLLEQSRQQTVQAIENLRNSSDEGRLAQAFSAKGLEKLGGILNLMASIPEEMEVREFIPPTMLDLVNDLAVVLHSGKGGSVPRERIRAVRETIANVQRICSLIDAINARNAVIEASTSLRGLRDYITSDIRQKEDKVPLKFESLVSRVISELAPFAKQSGVQIKWKSRPQREVEVLGIHREIVRALFEIMHNSIKYSWRREAEPPFVQMDTQLHKDETQDVVVLEVQNWGVPITKEEVENGKIFEIGYRGVYSHDRSRPGTGFGLTDAQQVLRDHGGEIIVESRPASGHYDEVQSLDYYKHPFLTTVSIRLPITGTSRKP